MRKTGRNPHLHDIQVRAIALAIVLAVCAAGTGSYGQAPAITIDGQVTDASTGQPLAGVMVADQCRESVVTSNGAGTYSITAGGIPCNVGAVALTYSRSAYRFVVRPSFEYQPVDVANFFTSSAMLDVEMQPYKLGYIADAVHQQVVRTKTGNPLDAVSFGAGAFGHDDLLFVDVVSADAGGDVNLNVVLTVGQQSVVLLTGASRAGHGGHLQMYGEFTNPPGTQAVTGSTHFAFSHSAVWPSQSVVTDAQFNDLTGELDWITGPFTVTLRDQTSGGARWAEWQVVRLRRAPMRVTIDIKPGSFPNSMNTRSRGRLPVAILTNDAFDATTVAPSTVRFGATGTEAVPVHAAQEDVDVDGDIDLVLHFDTQAAGIACGDTSAFLIGETTTGQKIQGSDSINTAGCR